MAAASPQVAARLQPVASNFAADWLQPAVNGVAYFFACRASPKNIFPIFRAPFATLISPKSNTSLFARSANEKNCVFPQNDCFRNVAFENRKSEMQIKKIEKI